MSLLRRAGTFAFCLLMLTCIQKPTGPDNLYNFPAPERLSVVPFDQAVILSWTSVPDACEYMIMRDNKEYKTCRDTFFLDIGLDTLTTYHYKVAARDSTSSVFGLCTTEGSAQPFSHAVLRVRDSYIISNDESNDSVPNPGESFSITSAIYNASFFSGLSNSSVTCLVTVQDTQIRVLSGIQPVSSYLRPGDSTKTTFRLEASPHCTVPHAFKLYYTIASETSVAGSPWYDTIMVTLKKMEEHLVLSPVMKVFNDANDDSIANPGEKCDCQLLMKNTGRSKSVGIQCTLHVDCMGITIPCDTFSLATLAPSCSSSLIFKVAIDSSCPTGDPVWFHVAMGDKFGNNWSDSVSLKICPDSPWVDISPSFAVISDYNGDSVINRGETVILCNYVRNTGTTRIQTPVRCVVSSEDSMITVVKAVDSIVLSAAVYPYVKKPFMPGDSATCSFSLRASTNIPGKHTFRLFYSLTDSLKNTWTDTAEYEVVKDQGIVDVSNDYFVVSDNSNDSIINPGESVTIRNTFKNAGALRVAAFRCTVSVKDSLITVSQKSVTCPALIPEASVTANFSLVISRSCPPNHRFILYYRIVDSLENSWQDSVEYTVLPSRARLLISPSWQVPVDNTNDGKINPGESLTLRNFIVNQGTSKAIGPIRCRITTTDTTCVIASGIDSCCFSGSGKISLVPGDSADVDFSLSIARDCPFGHDIAMVYSITDGSGNQWRDTVNYQVKAVEADVRLSPRYTVISDDNSDSLINRGETILLKYALKNNGSAKAATVACSLFTDDPMVQPLSTASTFLSILPKDSVTGNFKFQISSACSTSHSFSGFLKTVDCCGSVWRDTIILDIIPTRAIPTLLDSYSPSTMARGTRIYLSNYIKNAGTSLTPGPITCRIQTSDTNIVVISGITTYSSNILPGNSTTVSFTFDILAQCPSNHVFQLNYELSDKNGNVWKYDKDYTVQ